MKNFKDFYKILENHQFLQYELGYSRRNEKYAGKARKHANVALMPRKQRFPTLKILFWSFFYVKNLKLDSFLRKIQDKLIKF